jgi:hypothetical protein
LQFLSDAGLRDQGLLSRVLVAAPGSIAGSRFYRETSAGDDRAIRAYGGQMLRLLERSPQMAEGQRNELAPRIIPLSAAALPIWTAFYDHIERRCAPGSDLAPIPDFAGKAAEHAARIAGVLSIVENADCVAISAEAMTNATRLADWYVCEALRLAAQSMTNPATARAQRLLEWLQERYQPPAMIEVREIVRRAPAELRQKATADEAVKILADHGWLVEANARPKRYRLVEARP